MIIVGEARAGGTAVLESDTTLLESDRPGPPSDPTDPGHDMGSSSTGGNPHTERHTTVLSAEAKAAAFGSPSTPRCTTSRCGPRSLWWAVPGN
ncbi:hypothetical protein [Streptomyces canus]|uniref:hypothetical protein n=1 Tax=Streptomyces canus TaxID=58343 RepID=UPI0036E62E66